TPVGVASAQETLVERSFLPHAAPDREDLLFRPTGQDAAGERFVDRDRDPELAAARDVRTVLEVVDEAQSDLHRIDGTFGVATLDVFQLVVREPGRAHEARVDELRHGSPGLLERDSALVGPVQEIDVEVIPSQPPKAVPARRQDLLTAEPAAASGEARLRRDLRRDEKAAADELQRRADDFLVARREIVLGRIEPVD